MPSNSLGYWSILVVRLYFILHHSMSFLCPLEFIVGSTWSHTICSDLPRLLHHPWWCCQKIFPVWVWAPAFGCAMKLQFLACALATCLVAAQFQGASSGADVGAVEKEIANQTPQPAVPAEPGNRAVPAPSPTEKENRAARAGKGGQGGPGSGKGVWVAGAR